MQQKMNLLETAMGLICSGRASDEAFDEEWNTARRRFIDAYGVVLDAHLIKQRNKRVHVVNQHRNNQEIMDELLDLEGDLHFMIDKAQSAGQPWQRLQKQLEFVCRNIEEMKAIA